MTHAHRAELELVKESAKVAQLNTEQFKNDIETRIRSWGEALSDLEARQSAAEEKFEASVEKAENAVASRIVNEVAATYAQSDAERAELVQQMQAAQRDLTVRVDRLQAESAEAVDQRKAELKAQVAGLLADGKRLASQIDVAVSSQRQHIQTQVNQVQEWSAAAAEEQRIHAKSIAAEMHARATAFHNQMRDFTDTREAAWDEGFAKAERALL